MDLQDYLDKIKGITNTVVESNCFEGQLNVLEGIQMIQSKINEIIDDINQGLLKGDKGENATINVGTTTTLPPNQAANVIQRGDEQNRILDFQIPKGDTGEKGDKGDKGDHGGGANIDDNVITLYDTWSSNKISSEFNNFKNNIEDLQGMEYDTENNFLSIEGTKNGVIKDFKIEGKTLVVDSNNQVVVPGSPGAILKSVGDGVTEINLNSMNYNLYYGKVSLTGNSNESVLIDKFNIKTSGNYTISFNTTTPYRGNSIYLKSVNSSYARIIGTMTQSNNLAIGNFVINNDDLKIISNNSDSRIEIYRSNPDVVLPSNVMINLGNTRLNYIKNIYNDKKVLYKDTDGTWKKPTLRQWDSIEKHSDGKYYYHKRSSEYLILNGTENYGINRDGDTTIEFFLSGINPKFNGLIISENLESVLSAYNNKEYCRVSSNNIVISILKTKSSTPTEFKDWLKTNNIKLVYQLDKEQFFECTPIDLISYDTQTNYSIECGPIYPKSTFYISSDYGSVLSNIVRRMTQLENDFIEDRKAVFNLDFRTLAEKIYPEDFKNKSEEIINEYR